MNTNKKLATLELITGIFGWVSIIASLAAVYFLIMVVFLDGIWSDFFWAIGISMIAKWLMSGFNDNKKRVAYESHLISEGVTPEDAAKKWSEEYLK